MTTRAWVDALGAGAAQLVFSRRPAAGAILLLAVAVVAPVYALTAIVGLAAATAFAGWLRWNRLLLRDGLFGYNGLLVGLVWPAIVAPMTPEFWLLVPAAIGATALHGVLLPAFTRRDLPVLGVPFLLLGWTANIVASRVGWSGPAGAPPPTIRGPWAGWHDGVGLGSLEGGVAPMLFVVALALLAAALDSRARAATLLMGGVAGLAVAVVLGGAEGLLWRGAIAYNAAPAAVALADFARIGGWRVIALAMAGAAGTAALWTVATPPLLAIGLFPLTAPMHVVVLAVLASRRLVRARPACAAPAAPHAIDALSALLRRSSRIVALSGAGMSTESGIPDYRSQIGFWFDANAEDLAYHRVLGCEDSRRLYWRLQARFARVLEHARPHPGHLVLARLEREGRLLGIITQNVDGLHQQAGCSPERVIELHGSARWVVCTACGQRTPYRRLVTPRPAGSCAACGGILKTETVSFGEGLSPERVARAAEWSEAADLVLLLGSSFEVEPARSLPLLARARGVPIVVVNRTETPWDAMATLVIRADVAATLATAATAAPAPRIRQMTRSDFAFLCTVVDAWWGDHVRYLLHPMFVEQFGNTALVAEDEAGLAGLLIGFFSQTHREQAYVHMVSVAPDRRGRGIGSALYERFAALARAQGCRSVTALMVPYNAGGIAFHRALGFKSFEEGVVWQGDVPVLLDYAGPGVDCVLMQLEI